MIATEERTALLSAEQEAWRSWEFAVQAVPPDVVNDAVISGRTVQGHVAHIAAWHRWCAERLADRIEGRPPARYPDRDAFEHAFNADVGARWDGKPWDAVLVEAAAAYAAFRARVEELDGEQLAAEKELISACGSRHYSEYLDAVRGLVDRQPPEVTFGTPRLRLRSLRPSDAPALLAIFSDPEVMRYIPPGPPLTLERVQRSVDRRIALERSTGLTLWLVERTDTGETIGQCGFALVEGTGPDVEIAYHYARRAWGNGYASEAAIASLERGFERLGLERVIAICYPENVASWRVMEKAGMRFDGEGDYYGIRMKRYIADRATWRSPRGSS